MSKLLIDDNPLQVLPKLAEAIGLNEAIVIQQLHYWLNKSENIHEGKRWVYNTYQEWKESNFPFWSVQTIGNIFRSLEEKGLIVSKQINVKHWDRKKWYTIEYSELDRIENQIIERLNIASSIDTELDSLHNTETTTETNKDIDWKKLNQESKDRKKKHDENKPDTVSAILTAHRKNEPREQMRERVESVLRGRKPDWDSPRSLWNGYDRKLIKREKDTGETIEQFMEWFYGDDFRAKGYIYLKPSRIDDLWAVAFGANVKIKLDDGRGAYV